MNTIVTNQNNIPDTIDVSKYIDTNTVRFIIQHEIQQFESTLLANIQPLPDVASVPASVLSNPIHRVIVFDVETTGLCPKHIPGQPYPPDELYPHILQLCYVVYDMDLRRVVDQMNEYVRIPDNIPITDEVQRITGITRQTVNSKGRSLASVLLRFYDAMVKCDTLVAHNIRYDQTVIRKEMFRSKNDFKFLTGSAAKADEMVQSMTEKYFKARNKQTVCTMSSSIKICNLWIPPILDNSGNVIKTARRKMPKLSELYECLFKEPAPLGLHDALVDVETCLKCFLELVARFVPKRAE